MLGHTLTGPAREQLKAKVLGNMERLPNEDLRWVQEYDEEALEYKLLQVVALLAMTPEFQKR
ncbi:MAG: hypothetical protein AAGB22_00160 [Bacteroidota bacterium]